MDNSKSYYAVIPANVRYDDDITANAKLLYGEITALCNDKGYCWASNDYFAKLYNVSNRSITRWIKSLTDKGYIDYLIDPQEGNKRYLYLPNLQTKKSMPTDKNVYAYRQKCPTPTDKNVQHNNTYNNTTNITINKKNKKKKDFSFILENYSTDEEVLSLLNDWLDNRKSKHLAMTEHSIKLNLNKLDKMASESNMSVKDYLTEVVCRGWGSFFVISSYSNNQAKNKNDGWCFNPNEEDDLDFIK